MNELNQSKVDFITILSNLNRKFEIILSKWLNERDFEVRIRTEIEHDNDDYNGLCDQWVDEFSTVTNTTWVKKISNTGPKIRFRKQYQCWTGPADQVKKELLFDATRCQAVLDMKVLTDTPLTRRKNKHIRMGLNAVVKINFNHLHDVKSNYPFSFFVHNCLPHPEELEAGTEIIRKRNKKNKKNEENKHDTHLSSILQNSTNNAALLNSNNSLSTSSASASQHHTVQDQKNNSSNGATSSSGGDSVLMYTPTFLFDGHTLQHLQNLEHLAQQSQMNHHANNFHLNYK